MTSAKSKNEVEKLREEVKELKDNKKKTRRLISEMASFQADVGQSVVPYQRFFLYVFLAILFGIGIYVVVEGDTGKNPEGTTKSSYIAVGITLMVLAVIIFIGSYLWFKTVKSNRNVAKLNALAFEAGMVKNMFR